MHLSVVPQNRFGDLVEASLRVEQSTTTMYQSRQESKRSAPGTSQQSSGQYSRKKSKGRGCRGRGSALGIQTEPRTQARVYAMTQQEADAAPDVVTGIISILDHDAYTLVDPGATHSFASKAFLRSLPDKDPAIRGSYESFPSSWRSVILRQSIQR